MYQKYFKVFFDRSLAVATLLVLSPLLIVIGLLIAVRLGRPVLFRQRRPGLHGRSFEMLKFRTMTDGRDVAGRLLPDSKRLTRLGRFLRATSLDELPELFNVARGDMSLVGPRPLLVEYLGRYSSEQARRHEVRPGITGLAQINGRNTLPWDDKFRFDVWYVDHITAWLDFRILAITAWKALRRHGINEPGLDTASEFLGPSVAAASDQHGGGYVKSNSLYHG